MKMSPATCAMLGLATLTACTTTAEYMQQAEPQAVQIAVNRGELGLNCQSVTGQVISKDIRHPKCCLRRTGTRRVHDWRGPLGQRATYLVICPLNQTGCWSAGPRSMIQ